MAMADLAYRCCSGDPPAYVTRTTPIRQQVRAQTTSPNPALRFLLMGIALLIVNMWIRLHWLYLGFSGQGPRRVARARFRLELMTRFLSRVIKRVYGVISAVDPPTKPKPVIY